MLVHLRGNGASQVTPGHLVEAEVNPPEHAGVVPDVVCTAKSLAAGTPLSAVVGRADILSAPHPGGLGGTYSGSPISCVAALAALDILTQPAFLARATALGVRMRERLLGIQKAHPKLVGDVRGLGPMLLIDLVTDRTAKTPAPAHALAVIRRAVASGVLLIRAGLYSNCVRFMPPLVITEEELREGLAVVAEAVRHVEEHGP